MRKLFLIFLLCLITTSAFGQFQQKPMLGTQINRAHQLGDPIAFWLFNEGSGGKVFDLSGNNNTGLFEAATSWGVGLFGSCISFPGSGNSIINFGNLGVTGNWSISVWAKLVTSNGANYLLGFEGAAKGIFMGGSVVGQELGLYEGSSVLRSGYVISLNTWYHIVVIWDGTSYTYYVDGIYQDTDAGADMDLTADVYLGSRGDYFGDINADVDNLSIYNRILHPSEIALLYREPFCMVEREPIELWVIEEPPTGGQVIMIQMSMIPLIFFTLLCFIKGRKYAR